MIIALSGKIGSGKDIIGKIIQYLTDYTALGYRHPISEKDMNEYFYNKHNEDCSWQIKKFADKLKDIICLLIGCTREQLEDQEFKEKELREEWTIWKVLYVDNFESFWRLFNSKKEAKDWIKSCSDPLDCRALEKEILTPRRFLQLIGTDLFRNQLHPNIWINSLFTEYKFQNTEIGNYILEKEYGKYPNWIITDMRFPNELKAVKDKGGISIRVNRLRGIGKARLLHNSEKDVLGNHPSETALDNATFDYVIDNNQGIPELIEKVKEILIKEKIIK